MQQPVGIIAGTSFQFSGMTKDRPVQTIPTPFGDADIITLMGAVLALRHGKDGAVPAHRVSHAANLRALKDAGARCVIGIQSVGSLKQALPPGSLLVPDDYISLGSVPTLFEDNRAPHIVPAFDAALRLEVIGRNGDFDNAEEAYKELEEEIDRLNRELKAFKGEN